MRRDAVEHGGRDLASERATLLGAHRLRADRDARVVDRVADEIQPDSRRADDQFDALETGELRLERGAEGHRVSAR